MIALQGDAQALLNFPFVANGAPNCNVVAYGNSRDLAFRVQEYFREYYRWATKEPQTIKLPLLTAEQATAGRRVVVGLIEELPPDLQVEPGAAGAFGARGDVVLRDRQTPAELEQAVEGLLFSSTASMSAGAASDAGTFDGDPSKSPEALQAADGRAHSHRRRHRLAARGHGAARPDRVAVRPFRRSGASAAPGRS